MKKITPVRGNHYSYEEIVKTLDLRDSPFLKIEHAELKGCVQISHVTEEELLSNPAFATSRWIFQMETSEWCPIFHFAGSTSGFRTLVDIEDDINEKGSLWITPKGFPRMQWDNSMSALELEQEAAQTIEVHTARELAGVIAKHGGPRREVSKENPVTPSTVMTMGFLNCLLIAMQEQFRPFTNADFDQYSDVVSKTPLIGECGEFDVIIDDADIRIVYNANGPGQMTVLSATVKEVPCK